MDFGVGFSYRFLTSAKTRLYIDFGFNVTVMESEDNVAKSLSNYLGMGAFIQPAFEVFLTDEIYLEFGVNTILNDVSNTKNSFPDPFNQNRKIEYEGTGRWDLISGAPYIHIGYLLGRKDTRGTEKAVRASGADVSATDAYPGVEKPDGVGDTP
jgi:hypothetical protein